MIIYKEHLMYIGLVLVALIIIGIFTVTRYRSWPRSSDSSHKDASLKKAPDDNTMNSYIGGHYPNASSGL